MAISACVRTTAIAAGFAFIATPALAVTIDNMTDKALEVTVDLGATEPKVKVEAGKSAKLDCPEGCEVRAVDLNSYGVTAKIGDKLVIKDGMIAFAEGAAGKTNSKVD